MDDEGAGGAGSRERLLLAAVLGLALALRLAAAALLPEVRFPDSETYERLAGSIRERGELIDPNCGFRAAVTPGYPLFIAGCRAALGDSAWAYRGPQLLLGVLTVLGVGLLARELWGAAAGLLAAALAAVDPFAVYYETLQLTEALALCLLVWTALAGWWARGKTWAAPLAGALAGLTALVRGGWLLTCLALLALALALPGPDRPRERTGWLRAALAAAALVLVLSPWWIRNYRVLGRFVPLASGGGQSLYEGCSENATGGPAIPETVGVRMRNIHGLTELERSRLLSGEARRWIGENPGRFATLAAVKFARTWSPLPNEPAHRRWYHLLTSVLDWLAVLGLAGAGLWLAGARRARAWWCLAPALVVVFGHLFVIGSVRYRAPAWPFLEVLAGLGAATLAARLGWRGPGRAGREPEPGPEATAGASPPRGP